MEEPMPHRFISIACCALLGTHALAAEPPKKGADAAAAQRTAAAIELTDDQVRDLLRDRVDRAKRAPGIVVGLLDAKGRRVIAYGVMDKASGRKVDGDTLFEIGSLTKSFTGTLLADMVVRGEVKLDDPVSKYLPDSVKRLQVADKDVTLLQLATHTSGLPRIPSNMPLKVAEDPYADYRAADLYDFLGAFDRSTPPDPKPDYSNLGFGVLGHALALRAQADYATLLRERVLAPLGLRDTMVVVTPDRKDRFATGY
jgi:CubicO group peptidase (beta-lactamase class C family)